MSIRGNLQFINLLVVRENQYNKNTIEFGWGFLSEQYSYSGRV